MSADGQANAEALRRHGFIQPNIWLSYSTGRPNANQVTYINKGQSKTFPLEEGWEAKSVSRLVDDPRDRTAEKVRVYDVLVRRVPPRENEKLARILESDGFRQTMRELIAGAIEENAGAIADVILESHTMGDLPLRIADMFNFSGSDAERIVNDGRASTRPRRVHQSRAQEVSDE